MHKPTLLGALLLCALLTHPQKTDTLALFYKSDQFSISKADKQRLDSFLVKGWDRIAINSYTDETDEEDYNLELSKKRSDKVHEYFKTKKVSGNCMLPRFFGESMPKGDNNSDEGRALNRRTEIIGYQFARIKIKPAEPMKPVTRRLDNGFIITYKPGTIPDYLAANFEEGSAMDFQLISNIAEMRQNNMYNNTTRGEILSSVQIFCADQLDPCKLDSPMFVRVPVPFINCDIQKVKLFSTVWRRGARIWQEINKEISHEMIGGKPYMGIWIDSFCGCINFDFKIPECYDMDTTLVLITKAEIKNLSTELRGLNSVYLPEKINDSVYQLIFMKNNVDKAPITFALYNGKRRIRSFREQPLTSFPYDKTNNRYMFSTASFKISFPKLDVWDVVLRVNKDAYRVAPEKNKYDFLYLNRKDEIISVEFLIADRKGRMTFYQAQSVDSIPYDESKGCYVVDKNFLKQLQLKRTLTNTTAKAATLSAR